MNSVFLDTVGLLALWDESDQWHAAADSAFNGLKQESAPLLTTSYVLAECGNAAARRPYRLAVDRLRERLEAAAGLVVPTVEDWSAAWSAYRRGKAAGTGIVDQLSLAVMRRLEITRVFTNDQHFQAAGMEVLF